MYSIQKERAHANRTVVHCVSKVRYLLCLHGFGDMWLYEGGTDSNCVLELFRQRIKGAYYRSWRLVILGTTYQYIVDGPKVEIYLSVIKHITPYLAITKLRLRNTHLWLRTVGLTGASAFPYAERHCLFCYLGWWASCCTVLFLLQRN